MDLMKAAVAGEDAEKLIKVEGPLGLIYKQALDIVYRKEEEPPMEEITSILNQTKEPITKSNIATETQVNDFLMGQAILKDIVNGPDPKPTTIFAISEDDVTPETPSTVRSAIGASDDDQFILVVDNTNPATTNKEMTAADTKILASLESMVLRAGGKITHSFLETINAMK